MKKNKILYTINYDKIVIFKKGLPDLQSDLNLKATVKMKTILGKILHICMIQAG